MPDDTITLREAYDLFLASDVRALTPATQSGYRSMLNHWERLTSNPPIGEVSKDTLAEFRDSLLSIPLSPNTVRGWFRYLRCLLRRLGPPDSANPEGEGVLTRIPRCKLPRAVHKMPRTATILELERLYAACDVATWPRRGTVPAADLWRAAIVTIYNCGARSVDLRSMTRDHFDVEDRTVRFVARKTQKCQVVPANEIVLAHLQALLTDRELLFGFGKSPKPRFKQWHAIQEVAGTPITWHDLRRSCGTQFANVVGMDAAKFMLGNTVSGVAETFYVNPTERLRTGSEMIPQPEIFRSIFNRRPDLEPIVTKGAKPKRSNWTFRPGEAVYRGRTIKLAPNPLAVLQMLVTAARPVTADELLAAVWHNQTRSPITVKTTIAALRETLKRELQLPDRFNPIANLEDGAGWTIALPEPETDA